MDLIYIILMALSLVLIYYGLRTRKRGFCATYVVEGSIERAYIEISISGDVKYSDIEELEDQIAKSVGASPDDLMLIGLIEIKRWREEE